jgi:Spy/CpxP family protein refolding chaperone
MKKLLLLTLVLGVLGTSSVQAQNAAEPAAMLQQMKDRFVQPMVEKAGVTAAQAEKIVEINFEMRMAASGLRDLSEADRAKKLDELKATRDRKWTEVLTPEQVKAVKAFYEDMGKNQGARAKN